MSGLASSIQRLQESESFRRERVKSFANRAGQREMEQTSEPYDIRAPFKKVVPRPEAEDSLPKLQAFKLALLQYNQRSEEEKDAPKKVRRHSFVVRPLVQSKRKSQPRGVSERIPQARRRSSFFNLFSRP